MSADTEAEALARYNDAIVEAHSPSDSVNDFVYQYWCAVTRLAPIKLSDEVYFIGTSRFVEIA